MCYSVERSPAGGRVAGRWRQLRGCRPLRSASMGTRGILETKEYWGVGRGVKIWRDGGERGVVEWREEEGEEDGEGERWKVEGGRGKEEEEEGGEEES